MNWIFYLLIFLITGVLGWRRILPNRPSIESLLLGALFGLLLSSFLPFLLSLALSFLTAVFISQLIAIFFSSLLFVADRHFWLSEANKLKNWDLDRKIFVISFLILAIPCLILVSRVLFLSNGWYSTGFATAYGDVPFHLMYISSFSFGDNFPSQNPDYAGVLSDYPFLPYFLSAALVSLGASLTTGFMAPIFLLNLLILALLIYVPWRITGSCWVGVLVPFIFLLSGGIGFYCFFQSHGLDILSPQANFLGSYLDNASSIPQFNINMMNVVISSLLPQRGVLYGLPVFLGVLLLWFKPKRRLIIASAVLIGLLPLFHAHTFIALMIASPFCLLYLFLEQKRKNFDWRSWVLFFIIIFIAVFPLLLFFRPDTSNSFIRFTFGWMAKGDNLALYWLKNLGVFLLLLLFALFSKRVPKSLKFWYLPFISLFIVPNIILFSPWEFDNHKFFHLWYLVSSFLVAYVIIFLFKNKDILFKILAGLLLILIILSGGIDVLRAWYFSKEGYRLFSPEAQNLAEFLKQNTPPQSVFLSSTSPHSPLILSGRKRIMGFAGWLWAHGINYQERLNDSGLVYKGDEKTFSLLEKWKVDYILIGEQEKTEFSVNQEFFEKNLKRIYNEDGYQVFMKK